MYGIIHQTLCIRETPKRVILQTVYTFCKGLQTKEYNFFENDNLTPLDIYIGPFQVYCIKSER